MHGVRSLFALLCFVKYRSLRNLYLKISVRYTYVEGSKRFRPDIQKPRRMENAVRDIWCHLW